MKSDTLIKTIGFVPTRSQMSSQPQSRIVTSSLHRSIVESQHVPSPLIITPMPHVIHTNNDVVPAKVRFELILFIAWSDKDYSDINDLILFTDCSNTTTSFTFFCYK